jgi:hypothetical protein
LTLYVFCDAQFLCCYLRPCRIDTARHNAAILKLLDKRLRAQWPEAGIVFRGDSGFWFAGIINYCERAKADYIIGLARNTRLQQTTEFMELSMQDEFKLTGIKEAQMGLFATRTSCHHFQRNQLRMLVAALGYCLIERLRTLALAGTALATAQVDTLRIKLLKVSRRHHTQHGRARLYLASNWPSADIFVHSVAQLRSP